MIIITWLFILAVCLFSASVIWKGTEDIWLNWLEGRPWFFDSLDSWGSVQFYNNKRGSFSWSLDTPWYYLDLDYYPLDGLHWPYYIAYKTVNIWVWDIGWFTLEVSKVRND